MSVFAICNSDIVFSDWVKGCINNTFADADILQFYSGQMFLDCKKDFDVVFLSLELPELSGYYIAGKLRESRRLTKIIFVSAKAEAAIQCIPYMPFRFLMKNCSKTDLCEAVSALKEQLDTKLQTVCFYDRKKGGVRSLSVNEIMYIEVFHHDVVVHMKTENLMIKETLSAAAQKLCGHGFIQTHRSYLVNCLYIQSFNEDIYLTNGEKVYVSRRMKNQAYYQYQTYIANEMMHKE